MKGLLVLSAILMATNVFAAGKSRAKRSSYKSELISFKSMQPRMSLVHTLNADAAYTVNTNKEGTAPGSNLGVSFGIQDIKTKSLGYIATLNYLHLEDFDASMQVKGIELSGTYGVQHNAYLLAGFNRSEISLGNQSYQSKNAMQFGIGYRHNKKMSFELIRREIKGQRENMTADLETVDLNINLLL